MDNCVPLQAAPLFAAHDVQHARDLGWRDLTNGKLLAAAAEAGFDVMVTVDKNLRYQQNIDRLPVAVLELDVRKNRTDEIRAMGPSLLKGVEATLAYRLVRVTSDGGLECLAPRPR